MAVRAASSAEVPPPHHPQPVGVLVSSVGAVLVGEERLDAEARREEMAPGDTYGVARRTGR